MHTPTNTNCVICGKRYGFGDTVRCEESEDMCASCTLRLIAAAPDILAALQSFPDAMVAYGIDEGALHKFSPSLLAALQEHRAAIAKATGKE